MGRSKACHLVSGCLASRTLKPGSTSALPGLLLFSTASRLHNASQHSSSGSSPSLGSPAHGVTQADSHFVQQQHGTAYVSTCGQQQDIRQNAAHHQQHVQLQQRLSCILSGSPHHQQQQSSLRPLRQLQLLQQLSSLQPLQLQQQRSYAKSNKMTLTYQNREEPALDDYCGPPTNYVQLISAIKNAQNLDRLNELVRDYADKFDAVHVAAALARLPKLLRYRPQDFVVDKEVVAPGQGVHGSILKANAKLKPRHALIGSQLAAKLDAMLPAHIHGFFPRQVANIIWAFGELVRLNVPYNPRHLSNLLLTIKLGNYEAFEVHGTGAHLAQLLKGLSNLRTLYTDEGLVGALASYTRRHAASLNARHVHMAAAGFVRLNHTKEETFEALCNAARADVKNFPPQATASLFRSLANVQYIDTPLLDELAKGIEAQVVLLTPTDIAMLASASARLRYNNAPFMQLLGDRAVHLLKRFTDADAAKTLEGFAALGVHHLPLFQAVADDVLSHDKVDAQPEELAKVLFAYGTVARDDPQAQELYERVLGAWAKRLKQCKPGHLVAVCKALRAVRYQEDEALLDSTADRAIVLMPEMYAPDLDVIVATFVTLRPSAITLGAAAASRLEQLLNSEAQGDSGTAAAVAATPSSQDADANNAASTSGIGQGLTQPGATALPISSAADTAASASTLDAAGDGGAASAGTGYQAIGNEEDDADADPGGGERVQRPRTVQPHVAAALLINLTFHLGVASSPAAQGVVELVRRYNFASTQRPLPLDTLLSLMAAAQKAGITDPALFNVIGDGLTAAAEAETSAHQPQDRSASKGGRDLHVSLTSLVRALTTLSAEVTPVMAEDQGQQQAQGKGVRKGQEADAKNAKSETAMEKEATSEQLLIQVCDATAAKLSSGGSVVISEEELATVKERAGVLVASRKGGVQNAGTRLLTALQGLNK